MDTGKTSRCFLTLSISTNRLLVVVKHFTSLRLSIDDEN